MNITVAQEFEEWVKILNLKIEFDFSFYYHYARFPYDYEFELFLGHEGAD